jgi:hypothetical protein
MALTFCLQLHPTVFNQDSDQDEDKGREANHVNVGAPFSLNLHLFANDALNHQDKKRGGEIEKEAVSRGAPELEKEQGGDKEAHADSAT